MSALAIGAAFNPDAKIGHGAWGNCSWREVATDRENGRPYLAYVRKFTGTSKVWNTGSALSAAVTLEVCRRDGRFSLKQCSRDEALAVVGYLASKRAGGVHALWLAFYYEDDDFPFGVDVDNASPADLDAFARWLATEGYMPGFKSKAQMERCRGLVTGGKMTQQDFDAHVQASGDLSKLPDRLHPKK